MKSHFQRIPWVLVSCRIGSGITLAVILSGFLLLVSQAFPAFADARSGFPFGHDWFYPDALFGAASMLYGSIVVAGIALVVAVPIGMGCAILLSEYLPARLRWACKSGIEVLAGIPSVVYGLIGVLFLRDWVYASLTPFDPISGDTLLTAGLLLAVMILPTITTLSDDALRGVSSRQRLAARGLGLTKPESIISVVIPQAAPALGAAILLALGRAIGETVAVFLVVGRQDNQMPNHLLALETWIAPGQTLTSKLGGPETHLAYGDPSHWSAITGLAVLLIGMVLVCVVASILLERFFNRSSSRASAEPAL